MHLSEAIHRSNGYLSTTQYSTTATNCCNLTSCPHLERLKPPLQDHIPARQLELIEFELKLPLIGLPLYSMEEIQGGIRIYLKADSNCLTKPGHTTKEGLWTQAYSDIPYVSYFDKFAKIHRFRRHTTKMSINSTTVTSISSF
jgi:hypothetical protein